MTKVIFTADDYGAIEAIDNGIIDAVNKGEINSVAAFGNRFDSRERVKRLENLTQGKNPEIGCHLTITSGSPLTAVPDWMRDNKGRFQKYTKHKRPKNLNESERKSIKAELNAQIDNLTRNNGKVSHLSSHHNILYWFKDYWDMLVGISVERNIPMRSPLLRPVDSNKKYLFTVRLRSFSKVKLPNIQEIKNFNGQLERLLHEMNNGSRPKMPGFSDALFYGPPIHIFKSTDKISSATSEKIKDLNNELKRLSTHFETVEFIFHIIDDNYPKLKSYQASVKNRHTGYPGVDPSYFDRRMAEKRALPKIKLPKEMEMTQWVNI